ncbi:hypothetical protein EJV47_07720 [Hymenobacter gummosus]|uniref:Uncharacterized protein n=1 Tax=Hymenobacter gummosus TaxID=1776032 RepID=A0A431U5N5_9BACT|nr:hypothetical protein [Hymenobacter gummosus]RTQ51675.1 hypothetical protein EJV47_07720 [Hymenobacter gummosus]
MSVATEYIIRCPRLDEHALRQFLRRQFVVAGMASHQLRLALPVPGMENWRVTTLPTWPTVTLYLHPWSIYFCDQLAAPAEASHILRLLLDFLLTTPQNLRLPPPAAAEA